jgi:hypothetical protein
VFIGTAAMMGKDKQCVKLNGLTHNNVEAWCCEVSRGTAARGWLMAVNWRWRIRPWVRFALVTKGYLEVGALWLARGFALWCEQSYPA